MKSYMQMSREELLSLKASLEEEFKTEEAKGLSLNMARGKPGASQLALSMPMLDVINSKSDMKTLLGNDTRIYKEVAPEVDPVAPIKEEKVVDTESDSIRAYYVIVGSFKSKQRVENLRKRLVFMGFKESAILRNENGMYRVTTAPFNTHTDCWNEVFLIRKKYPQFADAWGLAVR